jgi:hypothetical protein
MTKSPRWPQRRCSLGRTGRYRGLTALRHLGPRPDIKRLVHDRRRRKRAESAAPV